MSAFTATSRIRLLSTPNTKYVLRRQTAVLWSGRNNEFHRTKASLFPPLLTSGGRVLRGRHALEAVAASAVEPLHVPSLIVDEVETTPIGAPVPKDFVKVKTLGSSDLNKSGRLIVVGDVHGCYEDFCRLLEACKFDEEKDNLVMAGDLVNKGPESIKVLKKAMKLNAYVVRGNHEDSALAAYYDYQRGEEILEKYAWVKDLKKKQIKFIESLPFAITIPSYKLIVVHAGLVPDTPIEQQDMFSMYKMRDLKRCEIRDSWIPLERPTEESMPWASQWKGPQHVIFGHDSSRRLQYHPYATGIDTGAVQGDLLSACVFPPMAKIPCPSGPAFRENLGMKIVSFDVEEPRKVYYPKPPSQLPISVAQSTADNLCMDMYAEVAKENEGEARQIA